MASTARSQPVTPCESCLAGHGFLLVARPSPRPIAHSGLHTWCSAFAPTAPADETPLGVWDWQARHWCMGLPTFAPMLASTLPPTGGADWAFEPKLDGWRALIYVDGAVTVRTRT